MWVQATDREMANLNAALDWAIGIGDADTAWVSPYRSASSGPASTVHDARWIAPVLDMPAAVAIHCGPRPRRGWRTPFPGVSPRNRTRLREMDVAFDEAGLGLTSAAHQAHASLAFFTGNPDEAIGHATSAADLALTAGDRRWGAVYCGLLANTLSRLVTPTMGSSVPNWRWRLRPRSGVAQCRGKPHSGWP